MAKKVKCPICEKMNNKEDTIKINSRYYCKNCGEKKQNEINKNKDGWDELYEYICKLYNIKQPTGMMFKQLKEFRDEPYNYTNAGMLLTLKYFYGTLENKVLDNTGLGIIPYYYERAKQHFVNILKVRKNEEIFQNNEKEKIVQVKLFSNRMKQNVLSFDDIQWEEDFNE